MLAHLHRQRSDFVWYLIAVLIGMASIWIAPHLPLVDYPQHVAQLTLLKDLLLGEGTWSEIVTINYYTPNLLTYLLGLSLSTVFSVSIAFKILISISYLAFIAVCIQFRKHSQLDHRLDWAFLLPFFGYAYKWGFITFIISAPVALLFILLTEKYIKEPSFKAGAMIFFVGLLLLEMHGLMFLFSFGVSSLLVITQVRHIQRLMTAYIPYLVLILIFIVIFLLNSAFNREMGMPAYTLQGASVEWGYDIKRVVHAFANTVTRSIKNFPASVYILTAMITFMLPWLLGLKPDMKNKPAILFFALVCLTLLFVPHHFLGTNLIHERYALLLIPSYIFLFSSKTIKNTPHKQTTHAALGKAAHVAIIIAVLCSLSLQTYSNFLFKQESQAIDRMLDKLDAKQKLFYIIADDYSESNYHNVYLHYPLWYQVNKGGFVEGNTVLGNFASLAPFPVRYKPTLLPEKAELNLTHAVNINLSQYRYLVVRSKAGEPLTSLFNEYICTPQLIDSNDQWQIYDVMNCKH